MRARLRKIFFWLIIAGISLLLLLAWLAGRERTLQYVVDDIMRRAQGDIKIVGARGGLYEGLIFDRLEVKRPHQIIVMEQGIILWEPTGFLSKTFQVRQAQVARVSVTITSKSNEPAQEPVSLELPINLNVPLATIGVLEIRDAGTAEAMKFSAIELGLQYGAKQWKIERASVDTPWGRVRASLGLDAVKPYALKGELAFVQERGETPYRVEATLAGKLAEIGVAGSFALKSATIGSKEGTQGNATATLAPFNAQPLRRAGVKIPRLVLREIDASLPDATFSVDASAEPGAGDSIVGVFTIHNATPGALDRQLLPVVTASTRFAGDAKRIAMTDLILDLGTAGQFRGTADYRNDAALTVLDRITLALTTQNLNLNGVHAKLRKTAIKGEATIKPAQGGVNIAGNFREAKLALSVEARADKETLNVARAELSAGSGRLSFDGSMKLKGDRDFQAKAVLKKFNPAEFGDYPAADLNADMVASGIAADAWRVKLDTVFAPSRFMGQPLSGKANLVASADALRDVDVALALGANQFFARGAMGIKAADSNATLTWKLDAPQLAQLHRDLAGSVNASGIASGSLSAPNIEAELQAKELRLFAEHRIKTASGRAKIAMNSKTDAALSADLQATGYASKAISVDRGSIKLDGTRTAHTLALAAANADFDMRLEGRGALGAGNRWKGEITRLDNRGNVPFNLLAPAMLQASADGQVDLGAARFDVSGGKLDIAQFRMAGGTIATSGRGAALPLAVAIPFSEALKRNIDTTLKVGAEWDITTTGRSAGASAGSTPLKVSGKLRVFREAGDIRFLSEPPFTAGLETLDIKADVADNQVRASFAAVGRQLGRVDFTAITSAERRGDVWGVPSSAPLQLKGEVDVPSLVWVARVAGKPGVTLDGRLRATVTGTGTFGSPNLNGQASGTAMAFAWPEHGIDYKNGVLEAEFSEDTLTVKRLTLASGGGNLEADGRLTISGVKSSGKLKVKLDRFEAVSRPDRLVVASGEGNMELDENRVSVNAKLKADRGFFELADKSDVTISDDIIIIGKAAPAARNESKMTTKVDLDIDLGREFRVRGAGLNGRLEGTLRVASVGAGLPRAIGTLTIEEGIYAVYGQKLAVERGVLTFAGPIHNPGIDLYAVRKNPQPSLAGNTVEAGVEVRGSALAPRAKLVSVPNVPETEKLSWLVLGRGLEGSSQTDFSLLSAAASGLLGSSQAASIQAKIAGTLGVDEFGISPQGAGQGGLLTLGKRISSRLFVAYEQGLGKVSNILKVRYTLSKRWAVQAQAGTESAVDALFTISFD